MPTIDRLSRREETGVERGCPFVLLHDLFAPCKLGTC
jgi:hypothetical protein